MKEKSTLSVKENNVTNDVLEETNENTKEVPNKNLREKRKVSIKRPNTTRLIKFKKKTSSLWSDGEVKKVREHKEDDYLICHILINNKDIIVIGFSEEEYEWKYSKGNSKNT